MKQGNGGKTWNEISGRAELHLGELERSTLEKLKHPNGGAFTLWVVFHLSVWGLGVLAVLLLHDTPWVVVCSLVLGNQLHAITILQHDCGHGSAYRHPAANLWVGRLLAWFIFMPFTTFTYLHKRHHAFLGQPDKDPDEWFYAGGVRWLFIREMLFLPRFVYESLGARLPERLRQQVRHELAFNSLSWLVLLSVSIYTDLIGWFVMAFLLPMVLLACVINPLSRGYEHFPLAEMAGSDASDAGRFDLRTNTVTITSPLLGFLWANITYHVEHHVYPNVPFYRLPRLHSLMRHKHYYQERYPLYRLLKTNHREPDRTASAVPAPFALSPQETEDAHR